MAEGDFPKSTGNVLFASEVNRLAGAGRAFGWTSGLDNLTSGTDFQDLGSVVISAGSLSNPALIIADLFVNTFQGVSRKIKWIISGASSNTSIQSTTPFGGNLYSQIRAFTGSPVNGFFSVTSDTLEFGDNNNVQAQGFNNLNTGSEVVVLIQIQTSGAAAGVGSVGMGALTVQGFRSTAGVSDL
ncbi:MAG: hypothetical protein IH964_12170 [Candidatus Dadabacteria bacterium]|nr:hypothetical protein [Candidatus Dadabacteria bacterium]